MQRRAYHSLCVFTSSQGPPGAHLCYEQTASAQRLSYSTQTLHSPGPRHRVGIHYVGPRRDLV